MATIIKALKNLEKDIKGLLKYDPNMESLLKHTRIITAKLINNQQALTAAEAAWLLNTEENFGLEALEIAETVLGLEKYSQTIADLYEK